jgi:hypothetical protein
MDKLLAMLRQRKLLVAIAATWAVCLLVCSLFYAFAVKPRGARLASVRSALADKTMLCETLADDNLKKLEVQAEADKKKLDSFILNGSSAQVDALLDQRFTRSGLGGRTITGIDADRDIKDSLTPGLVQPEKRKVEFQGNYPAFAKFLYALENGSPAFFVDSFSVRHDRNDPKVITGHITVLALRKVEPNLARGGSL